MENSKRNLDRRTFVSILLITGTASLALPVSAYADTAAEKQAEADKVRQRISAMLEELEDAEDNYYLALAEQEEALAAAEEASKQVESLSEQISETQAILASRASSMYRSGSSSFLDLLLGASSFQEFVNNWALLTRFNESDAELVQQTKNLRVEAQAQQAELEEQSALADEKAQEAKDIYDTALATIEELEVLLATLDEEAQRLLEEELAAEQEAEYLTQQETNTTTESQSSSSSGSSGSSSTSSSSSSSGSGTSYPEVADYAYENALGCPYVFGAAGPDAFDCSGLVVWAYKNAVGISLPHYTGSLYSVATWRGAVSEARRGDVLWRSGHVGIALNEGGSWFIHAPRPGAYVRDTDSLSGCGFTHALRFG